MSTTSVISIPALPPPPGVKSNFQHHESLFRWDILTVCFCLIPTTVAFVLRTYVRLGIKRSWLLEDYCCTISWILEVLFLAFTTRLMSNHGGEHQWDVTKSQASWVFQWTNIVICFYSPAVLFIKLGILLLYRRVFVVYKGGLMDWSTRLLIITVSGFEIALTIVKIWECLPRAKIWDKELDGHCVNLAAVLISSGVFNTVSDVIILFLPIRAVWSLQMSTKAKIGIISIFTIGAAAPIFSLVGMVMRIEIAPSTDVTFNQPKIHLFAAAEIASGLLCLCLPVLAALKPSRRHAQSLKRPSFSILPNNKHKRRNGHPSGNPGASSAGRYGYGYGMSGTTSSGLKKSLDDEAQDLVFDFELREDVCQREERGAAGRKGGGEVLTRIEGGGGDVEHSGGKANGVEGGTFNEVNGDVARRDEMGMEGRHHAIGVGGAVGGGRGKESIVRTVKIEQMQTYV